MDEFEQITPDLYWAMAFEDWQLLRGYYEQKRADEKRQMEQARRGATRGGQRSGRR